MLYVVATGRQPSDLTLAGCEVLQKADVVVVKSDKTHIKTMLARLNITNYQTCDALYEEAEDFDQLNLAIADQLTLLCKQHDKVAFCVYGSGADDSTVELLRTSGVPFELIAGVSLEAALPSCSDGRGVVVYTAAQLLQQHDFVTTGGVTVIKAIDDAFVASEVKLKLLTVYDYDSTVQISDGTTVKNILLEELDRQKKYSYCTSVAVLPKELTAKRTHDYCDIATVMRILRAPDGCPWDREQTHMSLRKNVIEEAYELSHAIEQGDTDNMVEELGDILMQVAFHIGIAEDEGEFCASDVYSALCNKLISRHAHVFGQLPKSATAEEALVNWEAAKKNEHKIVDLKHNLQDVPYSMSALMRAQKVQYRAKKGGYDFADIMQAVDKVKEELSEFLAEVDKGDAQLAEKEGGDLLFTAINVLRLAGVDGETALTSATDKFISRVALCEQELKRSGKTLSQLSMAEFDQLWQKVKQHEKG